MVYHSSAEYISSLFRTASTSTYRTRRAMPASIPNDIYQYSTTPAFQSGLTSGGPPAAFLTKHGTYGIGTFGDGQGMMLLDTVAWRLSGGGNEARWEKAPKEAQLPFVMVTVFEPAAALRLGEVEGLGETKSNEVTLKQLDEAMSSKSSRQGGWGKNAYLSVRIRGLFETVRTKHETLSDIKGTMFGFRAPAWAASTSPNGLHCHFLSDGNDRGERKGGIVEAFAVAEETVLDFASCGRFHQGLPLSEEFEMMKLA